MNTNNRSLLFENNIIYDTLYICLLDNVIKYSKNKNLEDNITLKLYYPLIEDSNYDEFLKKTKNKLVLKTNKYINSDAFINKNKVIDLFNAVKYNKTIFNHIEHKDRGIKNINFIIHTFINLNIPL